MSHSSTPHIGIVGAGRLGSSLGLALKHAGYAIAAVASANPADAQAFAARVHGAHSCDAAELVARCQLVVLAVPDDALPELAARLPFAPDHAVVHCSGALPLAVLDAAAARGAARGCLHPLQSFPERFADPARFAGISCGVEGDADLGDRLEAICRALGATPLRLEGVDRARYHAAAVFANNHVVALAAAAAQAFELAGLPADAARSALATLTQSAADNIARLPLADALTGPLARGDRATLERHLEALRADPELRALYAHLSLALLRLPLALTGEQRAGLEALLRKAL